MTLLITLVNRAQAVLVSDRRLTWPDGRPPDDEANKAVIVSMPRARVLVGFTGIAQVESKSTVEWFLEAFAAAAEPDFQSGPTIERFAATATSTFARLHHDRPTKRLSVVGVGYLDIGDPPLAARWRVSNFESADGTWRSDAADTFDVSLLQDLGKSTDAAFATLDGGWNAMGKDAERAYMRLTRMLKEGRPERGLAGKAVEVVRLAADHNAMIGPQVMTIVLPRANPPSWRYDSASVTPTTFAPAMLNLSPTGSVMVDNLQVTSGGPASGPKIPRNAP
ncbi:MAG TPA: hypothetical protein VIK32_09585, partial [Candidatus Limnocylindrales bacterium]